MELTPKQQTVELIKNAERILLVTHTGLDGDAVGSLLALQAALGKFGKDVAVATPDPVPVGLHFLAGAPTITQELSGTQDFVITLDTSQVHVEKLGYKHLADEKKLNIVITPSRGTFRPEHVSFGSGQLKFDLIIVLDTPTIERLGRFFDSHAQFFYETPVINIDHHSGNDFFGKVNWVDLTATSTAEILVALLESLGRDKSLLDPDIATLLLAGIMTDTESFQSTTTTPKSFTVAAQLVAAGARQQEIVQHIYRTKTLSTLRLWGKALTRLQEEPAHRFIWSTVSNDDLKAVHADESELSGVADELLRSASNIDFSLLLSERKGGYLQGSLRSVARGIDVSEIAKLFGGGGQPLAAGFRLPNANVGEVEREVIDRLRAYQEKRLALDLSPGSRPAAETASAAALTPSSPPPAPLAESSSLP
ncbi:DHH family phosphoesterase [Candidatus Berkelbacteria bacterium]|nr:DHH family phosphoesterase [Candidatus Berkelbacteria bacterium]